MAIKNITKAEKYKNCAVLLSKVLFLHLLYKNIAITEKIVE
tara:strand:+ start:580 stop:702 length:123 start_codon:yes stop_codon:yes gene_type:complete